MCGLVLLVCAIIIGGGLFDRSNSDRPGWGLMLGALVVGYFAWFGMVGD